MTRQARLIVLPTILSCIVGLSLLGASAASPATPGPVLTGARAAVPKPATGTPQHKSAHNRAVQPLVPDQWSEGVVTGNYSCAVAIGGTLWCWGANNSGQLGFGTKGASTDVSSPFQIGSLRAWVYVTANVDHTCATQGDNTLWCWGDNANGQVGDGTTTIRLSPTQVGNGDDWNQTQITAGFAHTCGIQTDGSLWCWGGNAQGQLGDGTLKDRLSPVQVGGASNWVSVGAGGQHTCAIRKDGTLWCWGDNSHGELGLGTGSGAYQDSPQQVGTDSWTQVSSGGSHTCAIRSDKTLWCWGTDGMNPEQDSPIRIGTDSNWAWVSAGVANTCAAKADESVSCWGINDHGQLGQGTTVPSGTPELITFRTGWISGSVGGEHTCLLRTDGGFWCMGYNSVGQLGTRAREDRYLPTPAGLTTPWNAVGDSGGSHTCAINKDSLLYCWGLNSAGQLGDGTTINQTLPEQIGVSSWTSVTGGEVMTCGILSNKTLWCWGNNAKGELGSGDTNPRLTPHQVGSNASWIQVSAGDDHVCAVQKNGSLWCWGNNDNGEIGDGTTNQALKPVQVMKSQKWASVSAGVTHTCAITKTEFLWCWGANDHGQIGDGTRVQRTNPTQVGTDTWRDVDTGGAYTCGIKQTGFLFCWGINNYGQTGNPAGGDVTSPLEVENHSWSEISVGLDHTCGTRPEHTLWCWGRNVDGDLGNKQVDGYVDHPSQVASQKGDPWLHADVYDDRTCARKAFMLCFGDDAIGQLGDGSPTPYRLTPASVLIIPA